MEVDQAGGSSLSTSAKRYAFTNEENIVVQAIDGSLTAEQLDLFLHDYGVLFGATSVATIEPESRVSVGWTKNGDVYTEPKVEPAPVEIA